MSIWEIEKSMVKEWLIWGGVSSWGGFFLFLSRQPFFASVGVPCVIVGGLLVVVTMWLRWRLPKVEAQVGTEAGEIRLVNNLLWFSVIVAIVGFATGLGLVVWYGSKNTAPFGIGWGLMLQMGTLFAFNLWRTQKLPVA